MRLTLLVITPPVLLPADVVMVKDTAVLTPPPLRLTVFTRALAWDPPLTTYWTPLGLLISTNSTTAFAVLGTDVPVEIDPLKTEAVEVAAIDSGVWAAARAIFTAAGLTA
jgi:hypothetical protein